MPACAVSTFPTKKDPKTIAENGKTDAYHFSDCSAPFVVDIYSDGISDQGAAATPNTAVSRG